MIEDTGYGFLVTLPDGSEIEVVTYSEALTLLAE